jgi:ParB-like nuclease family protein
MTERPPLHPACSAWPDYTEPDLLDLAADIESNGQANPIWLMPDGRVLDGKARWRACEIVGIKPLTEIYTGADPELFAISQNAKRRHMEKAAIVLIAARLCIRAQGGDRRSEDFKLSPDNLKISDIAKSLAVSNSTVANAKIVNEKGAPNVVDMVNKGKVRLRPAAVYAAMTPIDKQRGASAKEIKAAKGPTLADLKRPWKPKPTPAPIPGENLIGIHVLIAELRPLFERIRKQSVTNVSLISTSELGLIAQAGMRLLEGWASNDPTVARTRGQIVPLVRLERK